MTIVPNDITIKYMKLKYPMGTGSDEWVDIKTDFELESDAIGGTLSREDHNNSLGLSKVEELKLGLEKYKIRVETYNPKDKVESDEKTVLLEKVNIGLEIYNLIIGSKT